MKKNKVLLMVLAMVLVMVGSVSATLAYFSQTKSVNNTFTMGKLGNPTTFAFELLENEVQANDAGEYVTLSSTTKTGNTYSNLLPGSENAKNPYITITGLTSPAYVFVEVLNDDEDVLDCSVDAANWEALTGAEVSDNIDTNLKKHATVYMYKTTNNGIVAATADNPTNIASINILTDGIFTIDANAADTAVITPVKINAYICQAASFDSAADAWKACFAPQP